MVKQAVESGATVVTQPVQTMTPEQKSKAKR